MPATRTERQRIVLRLYCPHCRWPVATGWRYDYCRRCYRTFATGKYDKAH